MKEKKMCLLQLFAEAEAAAGRTGETAADAGQQGSAAAPQRAQTRDAAAAGSASSRVTWEEVKADPQFNREIQNIVKERLKADRKKDAPQPEAEDLQAHFDAHFAFELTVFIQKTRIEKVRGKRVISVQIRKATVSSRKKSVFLYVSAIWGANEYKRHTVFISILYFLTLSFFFRFLTENVHHYFVLCRAVIALGVVFADFDSQVAISPFCKIWFHIRPHGEAILQPTEAFCPSAHKRHQGTYEDRLR